MEDDEKLRFDHLRDLHRRSLSYSDTVDLKIAQVVALNGVILSFVFDKKNSAVSPDIYLVGLSFLLLSMGVGCYAYRAKIFHDGPSMEFFKDNGTVETLKRYLIKDIEHNETVHESKCQGLNRMIILNILALLLLITGYYYGG